VKRRLFEELGIQTNVVELFHFIYYADFGDLYEYEYVHVFIGEYNGRIACDTDEIADIRWIPFDTLKELMRAHPEQYCVWFLSAAPRVLEYIESGISILEN
jgi:isopentenyl-diphosphate delta-isomerase